MLNLLSIPIAYAAVDMTKFGNALNPIVTYVVHPLIALVFAVAIVVFVLGVIQLIIHGDDPDARKKGQNSIIYGVLGMFIMVSAWGIVYLISQTINTDFNNGVPAGTGSNPFTNQSTKSNFGNSIQ